MGREHGGGSGDGMLYWEQAAAVSGGLVPETPGDGLRRRASRREPVARGDEMAQQKRGLGKGLGALIPAAPASVGQGGSGPGTRDFAVLAPPASAPEVAAPGDAYFQEVAIGAITPNPRQPRQNFDEEALEELAASIREVGLLQPVVVRPVMPGHFELVMGERRWLACQRAGLEHVRRSCAARPTMICCAKRSWRTSIGSSSTRLKRPPRTSSCSTTSTPHTTNWPARWADRGRTSRTRSGSSS